MIKFMKMPKVELLNEIKIIIDRISSLLNENKCGGNDKSI